MKVFGLIITLRRRVAPLSSPPQCCQILRNCAKMAHLAPPLAHFDKNHLAALLLRLLPRFPIRRGDNFLEKRCTLQVCTEALLHIFTYGVLSLSRFYEACFSVLRATLNVQLAADRRRLDKFSLFPFLLSYTPPSSPRPSQGRKTVQ